MIEHGRGTYSCRIDGRAGYLRLFDDRIELIRAGRRGSQVAAVDVVPMHEVGGVSRGRPGRLFSEIRLVAAGGDLELKLATVDAPRVADLIEHLAAQAPLTPVEPVRTPDVPADASWAREIPSLAWTSEPAAAFLGEPTREPEPELAHAPEPAYALAPAVEPVEPAEPAEPTGPASTEPPAGGEPFLFEVPELVIPTVEMPQWQPLPDTWAPEAGLPERPRTEVEAFPGTPELGVALTEPDSGPGAEPAAPPDGAALAAAAALAQLEDLLGKLDGAARTDGEPSAIPPAEAAPAPAVRSLPGEAVAPEPEPAPAPAPVVPRPAELSPDLEKRLSRLEVLRSCGVMSEDEYALHEAEIFETAWSRSA